MELPHNFPDKDKRDAVRRHIQSLISLNSAAVHEWSAVLGLEFVAENEPEGNVCFARSPAIRDDYRTIFTAEDLLDYVMAVLYSEVSAPPSLDFAEVDVKDILQPTDSQNFWKLVRNGRQLRSV